MRILRLIGAIIIVGGFIFLYLQHKKKPTPETATPAHPAKSAIEQLMNGNERFVDGKPLHPNQDIQDREKLTGQESPIAIIVDCSESQVPPEIIFDQGIGDIYVIRVGGNVVGPIESDSIEFGARILKTPLILVLGHQNCHIVESVLNGNASIDELDHIALYMAPALERARTQEGDILENAIKANAQLTAQRLTLNPVLSELVHEKQLTIMAAYYNTTSGKVDLLDIQNLPPPPIKKARPPAPQPTPTPTPPPPAPRPTMPTPKIQPPSIKVPPPPSKS